MKKAVVILVLIFVLITIMSCGPTPSPYGWGTPTPRPTDAHDRIDFRGLPVTVERYIDREAGVVCYRYKSFDAGGISCLPIKDTLLGDD